MSLPSGKNAKQQLLIIFSIVYFVLNFCVHLAPEVVVGVNGNEVAIA